MDVVSLTTHVPVWTVLLVVCLVSLYIYCSRSLKTWKRLGVPGPTPLPFLGNMHHLLWSRSQRLKGNIRDMYKQYGKIYGVYAFNQPVLEVKDVDALKDVLVKDFTNFTDRYYLLDGVFQKPLLNSLVLQRGKTWKRLRQTMTPSFSIAKLKSSTNVMNTMARELNNKFKQNEDSGKMVTAHEVFNSFSFDIIMSMAFGFNLDILNSKHSETFQRLNEMTKVRPQAILGILLSKTLPFLDSFVRKMNLTVFDKESIEYLVRLIEKCVRERKSGQDQFKHSDVLQNLLHFEKSTTSNNLGCKWLSSEEVVGQMLSVLLAGYETTSRALQYTTYCLAKNRDVQDKLVEEIERIVGDEEEEVSYEACQKLRYMEAVLHETMRMYPPLIYLMRKAVNTTTVKGIPVPKGAVVLGNIYEYGRDPDYHQDPENFDPSRFYVDDGDDTEISHRKANTSNDNVESLAFGLGPRQCVGMRYAMLEMKIALVHILKKFVIVDATPNDLELDDLNGFISTKIPIKLKLAKRNIFTG